MNLIVTEFKTSCKYDYLKKNNVRLNHQNLVEVKGGCYKVFHILPLIASRLIS